MKIQEIVDNNIITKTVGIIFVSNILFRLRITEELEKISHELLKEWDCVFESKKNEDVTDIFLISSNNIFGKVEQMQKNEDNGEFKIVSEKNILSIFKKNGNLAYIIIKDYKESRQMYNALRWEISVHIAHRLEYESKFVFHASAVCKGNKTLVFFGNSRSGKSTNYVRMLNDSWVPISDDRVVIFLGNNGQVCVDKFWKSFQLRRDMLSVRELKKYTEQKCEKVSGFESKQNNVEQRYFHLENFNDIGASECIGLVFLDWMYQSMFPLKSEWIMKLLVESTLLFSRVWDDVNDKITNNFFDLLINLIETSKNIACDAKRFVEEKEEILNVLFE